MDGSLVHTGTSWEDYYRECESNPTRTVDSLLFRTGGTAAPATFGRGFLVDNLSLTSSDVECSTDCYVSPTGNDLNSGMSYADAKLTIQGGIDAVDVGGTVHVDDGTYAESPNITKSLHLVSPTGATARPSSSRPVRPTWARSPWASRQRCDGRRLHHRRSRCERIVLAATNLLVTPGVHDVTIADNRLRVGASTAARTATTASASRPRTCPRTISTASSSPTTCSCHSTRPGHGRSMSIPARTASRSRATPSPAHSASRA